MERENHIAFKEWASIVNALADGRQILILRKGGIREDGGAFQMEHGEFFLFPTYEHQNKTDLKPDAYHYLESALGSKPKDPGKLPIHYYAKTACVIQIKDEHALAKIRPFHVWSDEAVKKRFEYGREKGLFVIAIRVFRLQNSHLIEVTPEYAGCKSWVGLKSKLSTAGTQPILSDADFEKKRREINSLFAHQPIL